MRERTTGTDPEAWSREVQTLLGQLLALLRRAPGPGPLTTLLEPARELLERLRAGLGALEADGERREKATVYRLVAERLGERLRLGPAAALGLTLALCGETDPALLRDAPAPLATELAEAARVLLVVKVSYAAGAAHDARLRRLITVITLRDGQPVASDVEQELPWDQVPPEVREQRLVSGSPAVEYRLYPREAAPCR